MSQPPAHLPSARIKRRGLMLVISSPSGAGKSTIARNLLENDPGLSLSVSVTTRPRRGSEIEGVHYHFKSRRDFERMRDSEALLEWAEVHGNCYGTPREAAETAMAEGRDMLFDIDWQGALQLQEKMSADVVSIFILPPSIKELRRRLETRGQDAPDTIALRMEKSWDEISHWDGYDYVLVNDDLTETEAKLKSIITAERLRLSQQPKLVDHVRALQSEFEDTK